MNNSLRYFQSVSISKPACKTDEWIYDLYCGNARSEKMSHRFEQSTRDDFEKPFNKYDSSNEPAKGSSYDKKQSRDIANRIADSYTVSCGGSSSSSSGRGVGSGLSFEDHLIFAASSLRSAIQEIEETQFVSKEHRKQSLIVAICSLGSVIDSLEQPEANPKAMNSDGSNWFDFSPTISPCCGFNDSHSIGDSSYSSGEDQDIINECNDSINQRESRRMKEAQQILTELRVEEAALQRRHTMCVSIQRQKEPRRHQQQQQQQQKQEEEKEDHTQWSVSPWLDENNYPHDEYEDDDETDLHYNGLVRWSGRWPDYSQGKASKQIVQVRRGNNKYRAGFKI